MKHVNTIVAAVAFAVISTNTLLAQKPAATTAPAAGGGMKVVGMSVIQKDPAEKFGGSMVMGQQPGTRVYFALVSKDQFYVNLDEKASKIESFKDDKGTDLLKGDKGPENGFGPFADVSKDGRTCKFDVESDLLPTSGAASLSIKGKAVVTVGVDAKTAEQDDVELKKGAKLSVGGLQAIVESAGVSKMSDQSELEVTLQNDKGFDTIKSIYLTGPDGKAVQGEQRGYSNMGNTFSRTYSFKTAATKGKLGVVYFEKLQKLEVPIDVKVTLGL